MHYVPDNFHPLSHWIIMTLELNWTELNWIVILSSFWASQVTQMVKNPPAMQETQVQSLDWEDPLEKGRAIHSSILAWRILWTEEPGGLPSVGCKESDRWKTNTFPFITLILTEEGTDTLLFCCCSVAQLCPILCNPMDCSLPGSSVHEILQARIVEWVAIPFSMASSWSRD